MLVADLAEVEQLRVARAASACRSGVRLVALRRHHPRLRDRHARADHRAVGRVLLVRLDRPRVVEDVEAVHEDGLLDPLAAGVYQCVSRSMTTSYLHGLAQVERLDRHALDLEAHGVAAHRSDEVEPLQHLLEADRPADVGAERQTDVASDGATCGAATSRRQHRPGEQPGQRLSEAVAPVLPVVTVAGLDEADLHARCAEHRDERAVLADQRLVHAARHEHPLGDRRRVGEEAGARTRRPGAQRAPAGCGSRCSGTGERAGLQQQPTEDPERGACDGERRDRAEARAHQAPRPAGVGRERAAAPRARARARR